MGTKVTVFLAFFVVSSAFCAMDIEDVTFGFNNGYKQRKWAPLNVTIQSYNEPTTFNGELVVEVRSSFSDKPIYRYATPLQLSKTDRKHKKLYIYYPKTKVNFFIQLVRTKKFDRRNEPPISESRTTQELAPSVPIENKGYFVLALAPSGDKLQKFIDKKQLDEDSTQNAQITQAHIRYLPNSNAMPTRWVGYDAVDLMVIREVSLTDRRVSKQRQNALLEWVQRGGTLVVSGGSNFRYLKGSFIEQFLPVKLTREETIEKMPSALSQLGLNAEDVVSGFKIIHFEPRSECHTLLGTDEQIYIAKRNFGDGQIISFAFDYNVPPFSEQNVGETFWRWLLVTHGKSPKLFSEKYALFREHDDKIHKQFLSKMPTQIPLIKLLAVALPASLLSFGGLLLYFGKRGQATQKRNLSYWISGLIFVLVTVSTISVARAILPKKIETDRFSILSIYPERKNAHLQSYVSLRTTARTKMSIVLEQNTFIRPLRTDSIAKPPQFFQGTPFQLREISLEPWSPSTYVKETFFPLDAQQSQITLENTWKITGEEANNLGKVILSSSDLWLPNSPSKTIDKMPPHEELDGIRKTFTQILQQEGVLQYLSKPETLLDMEKVQTRTVLLGWTSQLKQVASMIPLMSTDENVTVNDEMLVIMYLDEKDKGM